MSIPRNKSTEEPVKETVTGGAIAPEEIRTEVQTEETGGFVPEKEDESTDNDSQ